MPDTKKPNAPESVINAVEQYLLEHATDDTVTTGEIAAEFPELQSDHDTNPKARAVVQYLHNSGRLCIDGENYQGYRVCVTEADREELLAGLRERIGQLNYRVQQTRDARLAHECNGDDDETPDEGDCAKCGGAIAGDPWLWFSYELCQECYDNKPASSDRFHEWIEQGAVADA
jgi:sugar lactone lactonase YvrE